MRPDAENASGFFMAENGAGAVCSIKMQKRAKILILTGWGWHDYAAAAAVGIRQFTDAEVRGMSTRRLPEFLLELSAMPPSYSRILIFGVGLTGSPGQLEVALKGLKSHRTAVEWVSVLPLPERLEAAIGRWVTLHVVSDADGIADAVARIYGMPKDDAFEARIGDLQKPLARAGEPWRTLVEAAMFAYRNYQDEAAYAQAIRRLAFGEGEDRWTTEERRLVAHFRRYGHRELIGKSPAMVELREKINVVAEHDRARVLILGESGTGKETVAIQLHNKSPRRGEPFVSFNCATVAPELLESRLLGYEKGAFTGAIEQRKGVFELADGGTLFLDEVGELPLAAQGVLLRVLEGGRFTRVGDREEVSVDVRVIAATNRNLASLVSEGKFREDLFYRLSVIPIRVPTLREHPEDIAAIADGYWLRTHAHRLKADQLVALQSYVWPGNVRELINVLERASVAGESDFNRLMNEHRALAAPLSAEQAENAPDNLEAAIRVHIRRVYERHGCNLSQTAVALGVSRNTARKHLADSTRPESA